MRALMQRTDRGAATLPQTTATKIFSVQGGKVHVIGIFGEVTTVMQAQANDVKLTANPTVGADVDLCTAVETNADAVGTMYHITGDLSDALIATTSGAAETLGDYQPLIVAPGDIDLSCAASNTGAVKWSILWRALDPGARVVRA